MIQIKSLADLIKYKEEIKARFQGRDDAGIEADKIQIRVHMGTSGIASGAKVIYEFLATELEKRNLDASVIRTGDMGYCFAEPTIEVKRPGEAPVVFGYVDKLRADEIIEKYIKNGELVDGILPVNYQTI